MKKPFFLLIIFCMFSMSACGFNCSYGKMPIDFPNTCWKAKEIDIFIEIKDNQSNTVEGTMKTDEEIEIVIFFGSSNTVAFYDKQEYKKGHDAESLFSGYGYFSPEKFTLEIYDEYKGVLPDDIEEITFIREDKK